MTSLVSIKTRFIQLFTIMNSTPYEAINLRHKHCLIADYIMPFSVSHHRILRQITTSLLTSHKSFPSQIDFKSLDERFEGEYNETFIIPNIFFKDFFIISLVEKGIHKSSRKSIFVFVRHVVSETAPDDIMEDGERFSNVRLFPISNHAFSLRSAYEDLFLLQG